MAMSFTICISDGCNYDHECCFNSDDDGEIEVNSKKKLLPGDTDSNQKVRCILT